MSMILHYAPDNASLCVRLALEEMGLPYATALVDRTARAQAEAEYLRLNPHGLIPTLVTPQGPVFETAAILLWLADTHPEHAMMPRPDAADRGAALAWLFWLSNTLHPALRILFYPDRHIAADLAGALSTATQGRIRTMLDRLEAFAALRPGWLGAATPSVLDCYLCPMLRWLALYPTGSTGWFDLSRWPSLHRVAVLMEGRSSTLAAILAEGLGPRPFTAPVEPVPPEGSAT